MRYLDEFIVGQESAKKVLSVAYVSSPHVVVYHRTPLTAVDAAGQKVFSITIIE